MINYTPSNQLTLAGFSHPFDNELDMDNRWIKLSKIIPWDDLANVYAQSLCSGSGRESINIRMVIGTLVIKHKLGLDDRGTVAMISENLYMQYFCGLSSFQPREPFHPTVFVDIRKRMGNARFDRWNELIIKKAEVLSANPRTKVGKPRKGQGQGTPCEGQPSETIPHKGKLKIDATVADQKIAYPTDSGLLNTAREECERIIDALYKQSGLVKKPRTYRRIARKEYLAFSKKKKKTKGVIRKFIRKQLGYIERDLGHIDLLLDRIASIKRQGNSQGPFSMGYDHYCDRFPLSKRDQRIYWVVQLLYQQQLQMYRDKTNSVPDRIVSIYQPYVRPIVRGKNKALVEFGSKISASEVDGMSRVEHISWDAFNESKDLILQVEAYKATFGYYPELLLADRIYLTRGNRKWLKEKAIRTTGKPLGRPPKEKPSAYQRRKQRKEANRRNLIEGKFGQAKNAYGLGNIQARRKDTSESWIGAIFFVMNLVKLLKIAGKCAIFWLYIKKATQQLSKPIHEVKWYTKINPTPDRIITLIWNP